MLKQCVLRLNLLKTKELHYIRYYSKTVTNEQKEKVFDASKKVHVPVMLDEILNYLVRNAPQFTVNILF